MGESPKHCPHVKMNASPRRRFGTSARKNASKSLQSRKHVGDSIPYRENRGSRYFFKLAESLTWFARCVGAASDGRVPDSSLISGRIVPSIVANYMKGAGDGLIPGNSVDRKGRSRGGRVVHERGIPGAISLAKEQMDRVEGRARDDHDEDPKQE